MFPDTVAIARETESLESKEKRLKRVPKGTSDYQASWIVDSGSEEEEAAKIVVS